jgi:hypothetical protein
LPSLIETPSAGTLNGDLNRQPDSAAVAHLGGGYLLQWLPGSDNAVLHSLDLSSWRALFLLAGVPGMAVAALVLAAPRPMAAADAPARKLRAVVQHLWEERRAYGPLTAATACTLTLTQAPSAWMPSANTA